MSERIVDLGDEDDVPAPVAPAKPAQKRRAAEITPDDHPAGSNGVMGRSLPNNPEVELYVLNAIVWEPDAMQHCRDVNLPPEAFYSGANRMIYKACLEIAEKNPPVTSELLFQTLVDKEQLQDIGGPIYLMEVTKISMGYIHIKTYVEKLRSLHVLREAIKVSTAAVEEAFEFTGSIDEFTSRLQERILKVTDGAIGRAQEPGRAITEFTYPADDDPDMLIGGEDFVGRGGALFLVSVTGSGKSPLQLDMCQDWALGRPWHGLKCCSPLKSLIIQHEDSDRYLGKIRSSYAFYNHLTAEQEALLKKNVIVRSLRGCNGPDFYRELERLKRLHNPDVIGINPLYLYAEGDISKSEHALRAITSLEKVNADRRAAYFIVHHTGKPPKKDSQQYDEMQDWESIYMGIGSSYWANWPRGSAFLQPTDEPGHYVLRLGKGAMNAGLVQKVQQGAGYRFETVTHINLKHSTGKIRIADRDRPMVFWEADGNGVSSNGTNGSAKPSLVPRKLTAGQTLETFLQFVPNPGEEPKNIQACKRDARSALAQTDKYWDELANAAGAAGLLRHVGTGIIRTSPPPPVLPSE
jgi:hypothetical protein